MHPLAVLSHLRPRFSYIFDHYGHARAAGRRQPAAAKTLVNDVLLLTIITFNILDSTHKGGYFGPKIPLAR